jgi:hypothetical protein
MASSVARGLPKLTRGFLQSAATVRSRCAGRQTTQIRCSRPPRRDQLMRKVPTRGRRDFRFFSRATIYNVYCNIRARQENRKYLIGKGLKFVRCARWKFAFLNQSNTPRWEFPRAPADREEGNARAGRGCFWPDDRAEHAPCKLARSEMLRGFVRTGTRIACQIPQYV